MDLTSEHFDSLDLTIYQPQKGFRYGPETLALADLCRLKKNDIVCELGSGSGVISCVLAKRDSPAKIVAVEIQEELCKIIQKNVNENHLQDIIECANADWRDYAKGHRGKFDVVLSNPPFFPVRGRTSPDPKRAAARHEIAGNLGELLFSAHELLKPHGRFFIVFDIKREGELKEKALGSGFELVLEKQNDFILFEFLRS